MYLNLIKKIQINKIIRYIIEVKDEEKIWQISKRYSNIYSLHKKLKKKIIIKFPKKKIFQTNNIEKRYNDLKNFINELNRIQDIKNNLYIREFVNSDISMYFINDLYDEILINNKIEIINLQKDKANDIYINVNELKEQVNAQLGYINILSENIKEGINKRDKIIEMIKKYLGNKKKINNEFKLIERNIEEIDEKYRELSLQNRLRKVGVKNSREQLIYYLNKCKKMDEDLSDIKVFFNKYSNEFKNLEFKYQNYLEINNLIKNKISKNIDDLRLIHFNSV